MLLAAGTGSRLRPLTLDAPKCLTMVARQPILQHLLDIFRTHGINKIIIATGYLEHRIREYLDEHASDMTIEYVFNPEYQTTNNIYSLWLTRVAISEAFVLIESDLIFDTDMFQEMVQPGRIAVSKILPWMNGTTLSLNNNNTVSAFHISANPSKHEVYKTVNICSLCLEDWYKVQDKLDYYMSEKKRNSYYEAVLSDLVADKTLIFEAVMFNKNRWYEIDTIEDLHAADQLFN